VPGAAEAQNRYADEPCLMRDEWTERGSEFGRRIYESVPNEERPGWAGAILAFVTEITGTDL
jgi:hypothetical protein